MSTIRVQTIGDAGAAITALVQNIARDTESALRRAARKAIPEMQKRVPRAFGELADSIHAVDTRRGGALVIDAPHAVAVEIGSRPHVVPLEALIRWVKLRGTQALSPYVKTRANPKARRVGAQLAAMAKRRGYTQIDAPERIARAIQAVIAKRGTKPTHYTAKSLPAIDRIVTTELIEQATRTTAR